MEKALKIRRDIQASTEEMHSSVKNLYDWEEEMKEKERKLLKNKPPEEEEDVNVPPVRSLNENDYDQVSAPVTPMEETSKPIGGEYSNEELNAKQKANISKMKGNDFVHQGKFQEAIYFYTDAINHFNGDAVFYSNRAHCYLKLKNFNQCIDDCNNALRIDNKIIKAYYRRMQAYEQLNEIDKSIKDAQAVLQLDANNLLTLQSLERLKKKRNRTENLNQSLKPSFTSTSSNIKEIPVISKPAHMRSKKSLKKIIVHETMSPKKDENHITDEVIEKLFNNNDVGSYTEIKKITKIQNRTAIEDFNAENSTVKMENDQLEIEKINESISGQKTTTPAINNEIPKPKVEGKPLTAPISSTQFHITWKELKDRERFEYLKSIKISNLNKILGPGLEPDITTEIFQILKHFYMKENLEIIDILAEYSKHDEFPILSVFLSGDDRDDLAEFIGYMKSRNNDPEIVAKIEHDYYYQKVYD